MTEEKHLPTVAEGGKKNRAQEYSKVVEPEGTEPKNTWMMMISKRPADGTAETKMTNVEETDGMKKMTGEETEGMKKMTNELHLGTAETKRMNGEEGTEGRKKIMTTINEVHLEPEEVETKMMIMTMIVAVQATTTGTMITTRMTISMRTMTISMRTMMTNTKKKGAIVEDLKEKENKKSGSYIPLFH